MSINSEEAIEWIHSRLPFGSRPGLERVEALLERVNNPHRKVPTIHIAGTNGKGSTVTYLRCLLQEAGITVGTFTSPYIEAFNERIAIDGEGIPDEQLIHYVEKYQPLVEEMDKQDEISGITEFETLTAMAFDYFLDQKVDVAIIEVGLGGLLDSTNVVEPILTGITTIGMDHTEILGETLEEIAFQKAGIIKNNIPVVTGNIEAAALNVIEKQAKEKQTPIYRFNQEYSIEYVHSDKDWGEVFSFIGEHGKIQKLKTPLLGQHQTENAGVAIELFSIYCQLTGQPFQVKTVRQGLLYAKWPARMEKISDEPLIVLDGAHNDHAMKRLVENLKTEFKGRSIHILFSALSTKNTDQMIKVLKNVPNTHLYLTTFEYPKAMNLDKFEKYTDDKTDIVSLWQFGMGEILEKMTNEDMLLVTGSLYFVSQVRELLLTIGGSNEQI
ncbi:bifunctional folylpolyglutamate synthase/dihydrofolate synthase [Enterococcus sp. BWT-B8]|uniref:bifunctional folylpolyglutamate synthase/dihydrofolate synthase n=1 Tax=Enterococcus sp. BWT-B8 TaxID=2885157 RepID=UPI001E490C6A|nr:folylpolyglutamate synthase/dihydrofolate synthase family protein [Enterococcus sp. BWT-B8]MCB5951578.1 bifunctional folylpolyglutamate synthase/dihydrofolate synthase [Enterococcus sp. BWT-B8]